MTPDYVVIGAGSAGSAITYRLAEAGRTVVLIEYGGSDRSVLIRMPGALSFPMNMPKYDWEYYTEPEPYLDNRRLACPRGKVIGGSSSINGMVYVRGHAGDYDHWRDSGAAGWGYADVLPYFKRMENWDPRGQGGDRTWRGQSGPLHVQRGTMENPLVKAFIEAGRECGYEVSDDYNGQKQEGFSPFDQTIHKGQRWSAARAYLDPAKATGRVTIKRGMVERIIIEDGRATGVQLTDGTIIRPKREVILSAGAINSPKILMLSGIGPAAHLADHDIELHADRPGVGQNLQDHPEVTVQMAASKPITLYRYWNLLGKAYVGARWLFTRTGPGASNQFESCAFIRTGAGVDYPDVQMHFMPIAVRYDGKVAAEGHGFQVHVGPMRCISTGSVTLKSTNPVEAPRILFNYMKEEKDRADFRTSIRLTREVLAADALAPFTKHEIKPGATVQTDEDLDAFVRAHMESSYHPCGTCKMGAADDPMAVVDPEARVIGIENLRCADSSVFPRITNGNLNAPSIMTGEKAADHILGKGTLAPDNAEPWFHPYWGTQQR